MESADVLVIGAGQAGLSAAHHLDRTGTDHVVLDAEDAPGGAWRHRWTSLTMATVNGIRELPGAPPPAVGGDVPARIAVPEYFADYEKRLATRIRRPVQIATVRSDGTVLLATDRAGREYRARALVNATGSWNRPFWPFYPGRDSFAGRQLHTHDYTGPAEFTGKRTVVIGGGISAVQLAMEIAPVVASLRWVTRRPPVWVEREFTAELGRAAVAMVDERVRRGLTPNSVVSVTGLPLTPALRAAREAGTLERHEMFAGIEPGGVRDADGTFHEADILFWCTGFRASLGHLGPLRLRGHGGGIVMDGTRTVVDPRVHLIGYGPSASTIGANRAGRAAVRDIRALLGLDAAADGLRRGRHAVID